MKKVYVIITHYAVCFDLTVGVQGVYSSRKTAISEFQKIAKKIKAQGEEEGWDMETSKGYFCTYQSGSAAENHASVELVEQTLNEQ